MLAPFPPILWVEVANYLAGGLPYWIIGGHRVLICPGLLRVMLYLRPLRVYVRLYAAKWSGVGASSAQPAPRIASRVELRSPVLPVQFKIFPIIHITPRTPILVNFPISLNCVCTFPLRGFWFAGRRLIT